MYVQSLFTKDHIEKIDFQEIIFAVVNWPKSELYGAIVCIIRYFGMSATSQQANVVLVAGWGVFVDFYSKYKIYWGEFRAHGVPIHERIKKFKTRIYIIIPIFPPPILSD